jgi:hypothetical protein
MIEKNNSIISEKSSINKDFENIVIFDDKNLLEKNI